MKNTKPMHRFAAGIVAALLGGGGILGFLLSGCFNPISVDFTPEENPSAWAGSRADDWTEPEPFTVTVQVGEPQGGRSIAGPGEAQVSQTGENSIRNFTQIVVLDAERNIVAVKEDRRTGDNSNLAKLAIKSLPVGKSYHFLLLIGHWERTYDESPGAAYNYDNTKPPTLLSAGLKTQTIESTSQNVDISVYPIQVDTKFTPNLSSYSVVEPAVVSGNPKPATLYGDTGLEWNFTWTVKGKVAYDNLKAAQDMANISGDPGYDAGGLKFLREKTGVEIIPPGTLAESPSSSSITKTWAVSGQGFAVTRAIGTGIKNNDTGWGYFNLEYIPFNKFNSQAWNTFKGDFPHLYNTEGLPVWIIRNGVNDTKQDDSTSFNFYDKWGKTKNGNGGVCFKVLELGAANVGVVSNAVIQKSVGGSNGLSLKNAVTKVKEDYDDWKDNPGTDTLDAWGIIYVDGDVDVTEVIEIDDTWPPMYLTTKSGSSPKLTLTSSPITVKDKGQLTLSGSINLAGNTSNTFPLVKVESGGKLTLEGDASITGNGDSAQHPDSGGGVYVDDDGEFLMKGGSISGNYAGAGGGVYVAEHGSFTMEGGTIENNSAGIGGGGGVQVHGGTFVMQGSDGVIGTINGNSTTGHGGGVMVLSSGTFTMNNGTITGNTAGSGSLNYGYGGGVAVGHNEVGASYDGDATFKMYGGTISANTANGDGSTGRGGGVWVRKRPANNVTFEKIGGLIYGDTGDVTTANNATGTTGTNSNGHAVFYEVGDSIADGFYELEISESYFCNGTLTGGAPINTQYLTGPNWTKTSTPTPTP